MEALELGSTLMLIDEDTTATNFMIRDARMQVKSSAKAGNGPTMYFCVAQPESGRNGEQEQAFLMVQ